MDNYSELEGINYINEQIKILNPDLIVTMNLGRKIKYLGDFERIEKRFYIYDAFHFSALSKSKRIIFWFYYPIVFRRRCFYIARWNLKVLNIHF